MNTSVGKRIAETAAVNDVTCTPHIVQLLRDGIC